MAAKRKYFVKYFTEFDRRTLSSNILDTAGGTESENKIQFTSQIQLSITATYLPSGGGPVPSLRPTTWQRSAVDTWLVSYVLVFFFPVTCPFIAIQFRWHGQSEWKRETEMALLEFFGCAFIAFGPALAMFAFTISKDPIRIIILIAR